MIAASSVDDLNIKRNSLSGPEVGRRGAKITSQVDEDIGRSAQFQEEAGVGQQTCALELRINVSAAGELINEISHRSVPAQGVAAGHAQEAVDPKVASHRSA